MTLAARKDRLVEIARKLVHGERDVDGARVTLESLTTAVSDYEAALAAAGRWTPSLHE